MTPGRSIAVDRVHEYGTPFFIEANLPIESGKQISPFRRLMIAQDTGSAIVGPARADLYWGAGDNAGCIAGRIRQPGRFVMLLPRELDPVVAGSEIPLPVAKPKIAGIEVATNSAKAGAIAISRQKRLLAPASARSRRAASRSRWRRNRGAPGLKSRKRAKAKRRPPTAARMGERSAGETEATWLCARG